MEEDLQRMSGLLARIPEGLEPLKKRFEGHVKKSGCAAVEKLVGGQASGALDPKAYVDALSEVHEKHSETVIRSFRDEAGFVASLDNACREFVNRNAATRSMNARSPGLLATHADLLLRKNNKLAKEDDLEVALERVVGFIPYLLFLSFFIIFFWQR
jgi:cullin 1